MGRAEQVQVERSSSTTKSGDWANVGTHRYRQEGLFEKRLFPVSKALVKRRAFYACAAGEKKTGKKTGGRRLDKDEFSQTGNWWGNDRLERAGGGGTSRRAGFKGEGNQDLRGGSA